MADGHEVRPLRMQVAKAPRRSEILPIHGPRRGQQEEVPLFRRGAFDVRVEERPGKGARLLRIRPQGAPDRQRERVLRQGLQRRGSRYGRGYPNALEPFLAAHGIRHQFIRPRTPEHNGKVERSHRIDQEKFYRNLRFYSLEDLRKQGKAWIYRYNSTPRMVLKLRSPNQAELDSLKRIMKNTGEVRCPRLLKRFTSADN